MWTGLKITFVFSLSIELLQLFLRLGTFQVSDLTYNILEEVLAGLCTGLVISFQSGGEPNNVCRR